MKILRTVYNVIQVILVVAIILATLLALLLSISGMDRINPKSVLGFRSFIVLSESMQPTFDKGALIIVNETDESKLFIGDIITYVPARGGDALLTHRIVEIVAGSGEEGQERKFITRGDANNTNDPNPVTPTQILGRTVFHMNGLGTFILQLRTLPGIVCLALVIIFGLFVIPHLLRPREVDNNPKGEEKDGQVKKTETIPEPTAETADDIANMSTETDEDKIEDEKENPDNSDE
jgi:signal peptidase